MMPEVLGRPDHTCLEDVEQPPEPDLAWQQVHRLALDLSLPQW